MGFSVWGLIVSVLVLAPNLLLLAFPPRGDAPSASIPWPASWLERIGQGACLVLPAISGGGAFAPVWIPVIAAALAVYYGLWARHFRSGRSWASLYAGLGPVPVPMAVFPVAAFLATAGLLWSWWIAVGAIVLGVGHIWSAWLIARVAVPSPA